MEAELTTLDTATVEAEWLRELLMDLPMVEKPKPPNHNNREKQTKNGCEKHNRKRRRTRWKLPDAKPGRSHGIAAQVNSSPANQPVSFNWPFLTGALSARFFTNRKRAHTPSAALGRPVSFIFGVQNCSKNRIA